MLSFEPPDKKACFLRGPLVLTKVKNENVSYILDLRSHVYCKVRQ